MLLLFVGSPVLLYQMICGKCLATISSWYHILLCVQLLVVSQVHGEIKSMITVLANVLGCAMGQLMLELRTKCYIFLMAVLTLKTEIWMLAFDMDR